MRLVSPLKRLYQLKVILARYVLWPDSFMYETHNPSLFLKQSAYMYVCGGAVSGKLHTK